MNVSNKFLAFLLVISIVVTLIGTWYSIDKVNKFATLTGFGTEGYVNITITNFTSINVTATDCDFGSGYVNAGKLYAVLNPGDDTGNCSATAYSENWTNASTYNPQCMVVENDGNYGAIINVSSSKNADTFLGGASSLNDYRVWSDVKDEGGGSSCYGGGVLYNGLEMNTSDRTICDCLYNNDTADELYVGCYLQIPNGAPTGLKTDTWTFTAEARDPSSCYL